MKIVLLFSSLLIITSCSTHTYRSDMNAKYMNDKVTVRTAIQLASTAYMKSCMKHSDIGQPKCLSETEKYIKKYIIEILDQPGK
ncbi:MAG: hypothetical protein GY909_17315 [Oligoflexia bacterium]|nr:hypothetical protein [Oligoflexia bacterium]